MAKQKILVTVKTYPTLSKKYDELVCTAGVLEDGTWIRLYPIQFRKLGYIKQYKKYDWIEIDIVNNTTDFRPESYRPISEDTEIKIVAHLDTKYNWAERKKFVLNNVYTNLAKLITDAKDKSLCTSLATFKPTEIVDFVYEDEKERDWNRKKLEELNQLKLFEKRNNRFQVVRKLPYKFSFIFKDDAGKRSKLMIEDWETGQLFWNCLDECKDEKIACEKVKDKYLNDLAKTKDLYFFLGTTKVHHFRAPNPFIIIGAFYPKKVEQESLF